MALTNDTPASKLETELRRGALVLATLSQLRSAQYGYSLARPSRSRACRSKRERCIPFCAGWRSKACLPATGESRTAARRYYKLNSKGTRLLADLTANWQKLVGTMNRLLK